MTMFVYDCFTKEDQSKWKMIENPQFIPTVGSRVLMGYAPAPRVKEVVYDCEHDYVAVECE